MFVYILFNRYHQYLEEQKRQNGEEGSSKGKKRKRDEVEEDIEQLNEAKKLAQKIVQTMEVDNSRRPNEASSSTPEECKVHMLAIVENNNAINTQTKKIKAIEKNLKEIKNHITNF